MTRKNVDDGKKYRGKLNGIIILILRVFFSVTTKNNTVQFKVMLLKYYIV